MNNTDIEKQRNKIIESLAETIGVDPDDIKPEDSFLDELHMSTLDLADFIHKLDSSGIDTSSVDLEDLETVGDLLESLSL